MLQAIITTYKRNYGGGYRSAMVERIAIVQPNGTKLLAPLRNCPETGFLARLAWERGQEAGLRYKLSQPLKRRA